MGLETLAEYVTDLESALVRINRPNPSILDRGKPYLAALPVYSPRSLRAW